MYTGTSSQSPLLTRPWLSVHSPTLWYSKHGLGGSDHPARQGPPSSCHNIPLFSLNPPGDRIKIYIKKKKREGGWKHCCNAPVLPGESSVRVEEGTLLPARTVTWLSWICLSLLIFPFLHSLIVPHSAAIWKPREYSSVLQSRWFTYPSL